MRTACARRCSATDTATPALAARLHDAVDAYGNPSLGRLPGTPDVGTREDRSGGYGIVCGALRHRADAPSQAMRWHRNRKTLASQRGDPFGALLLNDWYLRREADIADRDGD